MNAVDRFRRALGASILVATLAPAAAARAQTARIDPEVAAQVEKEGKGTYWVVLAEQADLGPAAGLGWEGRGRFVVERLQGVAERTQAGLRGLLRATGTEFAPFWAANVIRVTSGRGVLNALAARPEVKRIEADRVYRIPEPIPGSKEALVETVEWNIANIRANQVWSTFGDRGEGIVVASIDTGTQYDHPAIVNQYRGKLGGGAFDHNYNWYDPSSICGSPSLAPCDNNSHGTHTMGTIVGDDGAGNQIGVAPGARWITAKGCESSSCSTTALVASGQWMLAPTDLTGQNPRADRRPHVVSNSWGDGPGSTFYQQIVQSWVAAGMFPVFANGNAGPACGTVGSPGDYPESYGVGAYDSANTVASFSSRGPSVLGVTKPNISAPGVNVRSSVPGGSYAAYSGTSMATPHVAGVVALMWSAAAPLLGDIAGTRAILDQTAIDTADSTCGGSASNNNVYGEGRMDAFAAVDQSPRGPTGTLSGLVTDAVSGLPLAGITLRAVGPSSRTTTSDATGGYSFTLPVGTYDVTASSFGYVSQTASGLLVSQGATTTRSFAMAPAPSHALSGIVTDTEGNAVANATVAILGTPVPPVTTNAAGLYVFGSVPDSTYDVKAQAGRCNDPQTRTVTLSGADALLDFSLPPRTDAFGYGCQLISSAWVDGTDVLALAGDDSAVAAPLPFPFPFYGASYATAFVSTNGFLTFVTASGAYANGTIPSVSEPNAAVYALWDDLYVDASASVRTAVIGESPNRSFVVEWRNVTFYAATTLRVDVEIELTEGGEILTRYRNIDPAASQERGGSATLGLENPGGTVGFPYSFNETVVSEGLAIRYRVATFTGVEGRVTDANDGLAVAAAPVRALVSGTPVAATTTDANGYYRFTLTDGTYTIEASAPNYEGQSSTATLLPGQLLRRDFALRTARAEVAPASLAFSQTPGQTRLQNLTVSSTGGLDLHWQIAESGPDVPWLSELPVSGSTAPGASQLVEVTADSTGLAIGTYSATLLLTSDSGRRPSLSIPVTLAVKYDQAVNAGGPLYTDIFGATWSADVAYTPGPYGYTNGASTTASTKQKIANAPDPTVFRTQRIDPGWYRFDNLAPGTYVITLYFAELKQIKKGARVFDVNVVPEGSAMQTITNHDIVREVGVLAADTHTFTVTLADTNGARGAELGIEFVAKTAQKPIVNAIRLQTP